MIYSEELVPGDVVSLRALAPVKTRKLNSTVSVCLSV